jgi:short-subunit dehydrogenase
MTEKIIVITGSARGIGFALANEFLKTGNKVVITGKSIENLDKAAQKLIDYKDKTEFILCDVTDITSLENLGEKTLKKFGKIDIWINNAGINQPMIPVWEVDQTKIKDIVNTNILGVINGSKIAIELMLKQGYGFIYNMEGLGSSGEHRENTTLYGMTKCALRYFTRGLMEEIKDTNVKIGTLSPGIVITDFILEPMKNHKKTMEQAKKVFNILADRPETVASFLVPKMLKNNKNGAKFFYLTNRKAFYRFLTAPFNKRDFFKEI